MPGPQCLGSSMHPSWGGYGGAPQPPPHFGPRPHQFRGPQPPPAAAATAGFGGYGAPAITASSNFSSLHEQHLQQMQQLQQLHQKQLQSVLHHPGNTNATSSGPSPYWQTGGAPPNNFQDPSTLRGPTGPPQPQPPPPEVKPPAPEPASSSLPAAKTPAPVPQVSDTGSSVADEKPDFSSMSQKASFCCISSSSSSSSSISSSCYSCCSSS